MEEAEGCLFSIMGLLVNMLACYFRAAELSNGEED